jgi:hypothetical protein
MHKRKNPLLKLHICYALNERYKYRLTRSGESIYFKSNATQNGKGKPMKTYDATFETDFGLEFATVHATNLRGATKMLKSEFPDDIGSDGFWTDADGNETPINW